MAGPSRAVRGLDAGSVRTAAQHGGGLPASQHRGTRLYDRLAQRRYRQGHRRDEPDAGEDSRGAGPVAARPRPVAVPDPAPPALGDGTAHGDEPWARRTTGPGANALKPVRAGLDPVNRSGKRLPQCPFQVVVGGSHAVTSLPAASWHLLLQNQPERRHCPSRMAFHRTPADAHRGSYLSLG